MFARQRIASLIPKLFCTPFRAASAVPLALISELRKSFGASIQKCKEALEQTGGVITDAMELLRKRGESINQKIGASVAGGHKVSAIQSNYNTAVITKTTSQTDFASASELFVKFSEQVGKALATTDSVELFPSPSETLPLNGSAISSQIRGETLSQVQSEMSSILTEPVKVDSVTRLSGDVVGVYIHGKSQYSVHVGSAVSAVTIGLRSASCSMTDLSTEQVKGLVALSQLLARQVMASSPRWVSQSDVPPAEIAEQRRLLEQKVSDASAIERAFVGHMKKYYAETCLMEGEWLVSETPREVFTVRDFVRAKCGQLHIDPAACIVVEKFVIVK